MENRPSVAIIVLNWNGLSDTRECLASLRGVSYPDLRVIVVDNGSDNDEAGTIEREFGGFAEVVRNPANLGFAGGANAGIRRALKDAPGYLLLLNNDVLVEPGFLDAMVDAAQRLPDFAAACPKAYFHHDPDLIYSTGGRVNMWTGGARQVGRGEKDNGRFDEIAERDYADGLCMLISGRALEQVGLLDDDYFLYWEETDWCLRARALGLRCYYVPGARVWHKAQRSLAPDAGFHYMYRRNALLFVRKRGSALQLITALLAHLFFFGPRYFIRRPGKIGRAFAELRALFWHARNPAKQPPLIENEVPK
jgi:GT2 family glycosyltransferase